MGSSGFGSPSKELQKKKVAVETGVFLECCTF